MKNYSEITAQLAAESVGFRCNVPLCDYTSFKIGGAAAVFATPRNCDEVAAVMRLCARFDAPRFVLGRGSNLLVSDAGFDGVVIHIGAEFGSVCADGNLITAGGGASLASACRAALDNGLTGLEFCYGIPGSVGGGAVMNAGAYGGELGEVIRSIEYVDSDGQKHQKNRGELEFSYRRSSLSEKGCTVTEVCFELQRGDKAAIKAKMDDILARRADKQPLNYPSAGSVFLRPEGHFAGALIEQAGLKGFTVGGAQVSKKHAGFIINVGGATASDVARLIEIIKNRVYADSGVMLQCEIKRLGSFAGCAESE